MKYLILTIIILTFIVGCSRVPEIPTPEPDTTTPTTLPSPTETPTLKMGPTQNKALPEVILAALESSVRLSGDFLVQLDQDWVYTEGYFEYGDSDVRILGNGNWEGYFITREIVRSGEAVLATFQILSDTNIELGFRPTKPGLGSGWVEGKISVGFYLDQHWVGTSLWDYGRFIDDPVLFPTEGNLDLEPDHTYYYFGAFGDESCLIMIWDQADPSSYILFSLNYLDGWTYPGWHFFVNTNFGELILKSYEKWAIDFQTAGIADYVSAVAETEYSTTPETTPLEPLPVSSSSYEASITSLHIETGGTLAVGYADFNQDGLEDVFAAYISGTTGTVPVKLFLQDSRGDFIEDTSFLPEPLPGTVHARKAVVADFNADNVPDVFIADHGFDQPPFPGAKPLLLLSTNEGYRVTEIPGVPQGFQHSATAADINGDGSPDIFVTDITNGAFLLLNDGTGQFTLTRSRIPYIWAGYFTSELIDLDDDGYYDLLVGGHEQEGAVTWVCWGSSEGKYSYANATRIPADRDYRIVLDFDAGDLNNDGNQELVITRTKSTPFYQGYYFQILELHDRKFTDISTNIIPDRFNWEGSQGYWVPWITLRDFNDDGYLDLVNPNKRHSMIFINDGNGNLQREP
jgi:hypothetical protein